jgi:CheY-like chemotaxis protein/two-component sensor histidine kinase
LSDEQRTLANTVFTSSAALLDIVNDILDLSKIEAGAVPLEHIGFDLSQALQCVADRLNPLAHEKNLPPLRLEESRPSYVMGDPTRFIGILTNLASNAIKYTDQGEVCIRLTHSTIDEAHILCRCAVIDTGIGIPADKQASVFDKFVQTDSSTTRKYGGTGLGLAITKQLVELMGGTIGLESEIGKGSTFWFEIPFAITDRLHHEKGNNRKTALQGTLALAKARVLVAEDHPMNRLFVGKLLERFGIGAFRIVGTGAEAVDQADSGAWDMILMDCHMPEMNGYDATIAIRRREEGTSRHIPIIAMTANAMVGDREKCLRCGMDDYISKPIVMEELAKLMGQWIAFPDTVSTPRVSDDIQPCLDLARLRDFSEGDAAMERELAAMFVMQSEIDMQVLAANRSEGPNRAWSEAAHMLKGGAGGIGAETLRILCAEAQTMEDVPATAREALFAEIETAYAAVKTALYRKGLLE